MPAITKQCRLTGREFTISEREQEMYREFGFPLSDLHPEMRLMQKLVHGNNWNFYPAQDARTGDGFLSVYDPARNPKIFHHTHWSSIDFDAREFGREFDFSRTFGEQFKELRDAAPKPNLVLINCTDCEYSHNIMNSRHCYLLINAIECENLFYSNRVFHSKDSAELFECKHCERCFQCSNSESCYNVAYAAMATNCQDSRFLYNCVSCRDCYQCANLSHKQYCIQNQQYTKDEYERRLRSVDLSSYQVWKEESKNWEAFLQTQPFQAEQNINCEASDGILLRNCKNCHKCFALAESEDCVSCYGLRMRTAVDASGFAGERAIMSLGVVNSRSIAFTMIAEHCYDIEYSDMMFDSHNCFGCFGLRKAEFCILNKPYGRDEFFALRERIIEHMKKSGEWGRFISPETSSFFYDETIANVLFPVTDAARARELGVRWREKKSGESEKGEKVSGLPDHAVDFKTDWCEKIWKCAETERPFKIIPAELELYKSLGVPLPRLGWKTRLEQGYRKSFPLPHETTCVVCGKSIYSMAAPQETKRPLWCAECFRKKFR